MGTFLALVTGLANQWWQSSWKVKVATFIIIIVLAVAGYIWYQGWKISELTQQISDMVLGGKLEEDSNLGKEIEGLKNAANTQANIAQNANANLANSLKRDSNQSTGSQSATDDNYCRQYCNDSSCAEWRKSHPCP